MTSRWFTVLIALLAQGMALMSPLCFVRCYGADGHQCVELAGQDCHCCDGQTAELPPVGAVSACCDRCHDHDEESEAPVGPQVAAQDCSCLHSPMEATPQTVSKSVAAEPSSPLCDVVVAPTMWNAFVDVCDFDEIRLRQWLLRPQESPQLSALATVVLRV